MAQHIIYYGAHQFYSVLDFLVSLTFSHQKFMRIHLTSVQSKLVTWWLSFDIRPYIALVIMPWNQVSWNLWSIIALHFLTGADTKVSFTPDALRCVVVLRGNANSQRIRCERILSLVRVRGTCETGDHSAVSATIALPVARVAGKLGLKFFGNLYFSAFM